MADTAFSLQRWRRSPRVGYLVALATTVLALSLTLALRAPLERVVFVLCYLAVALSAWAGGFRPALMALGLSLAGINYLILPPVNEWSLTQEGLIPTLAFGLVSGVIAWLASSQRQLTFDLAGQAARLQRNTDFLVQAQSSAQLGSWEWDIATGRVTWSDQMFRVYGREPNSFAVKYEVFKSFIHPEDRELAEAAITSSLRSGQPFSYDHRVVWPDGSVRWVNGRGSPVVGANGEVIGMIGSGQDITERKNAANAQRLLAEASDALADSLDYRKTLGVVANLAVRDLADWCSVAIGDETGRYENLAVAHRDPERVAWVQEYSRLNPPRFDTPTGVPQVLRTGKSELYPEIDDKLLEAAATTEAERRVIQELGLSSAIVVPMEARGRVIGAISFISAESKRRYGQEDLWFAERLANRAAHAIDTARLFEELAAAKSDAENANAAKSQFLAAMSHELRTPLNAIAGYAELLELGVLGATTDRQLEALGRLQRSQRYLGSLVDQVLNFARIEAGKIEYILADVPVNDALTTIGDMIAQQAAEKKIAYDFDGCGSDIAVRADRDRFDQIMLNLVGNAVKYTPSGGKVKLSVRCNERWVSVSVSDTGPGIPAEKHEHIFQPFVQLQAGPDAGRTGVGLGLAISRDLAKAMGGEIAVKSDAGNGSVFTVTLPRAGAPAGSA